MTPADLERAHKVDMVYCYNCGEELLRTEGKIMCVNGCGKININEGSLCINRVYVCHYVLNTSIKHST